MVIIIYHWENILQIGGIWSLLIEESKELGRINGPSVAKNNILLKHIYAY